MYETLLQIQGNGLLCDRLIYPSPLQHNTSFYRDVHNDCELLLFLRGNATYIIEDKRYKLKHGDLVIIRPSKYHYIQIDGDADYERYDLLFPTSAVGDELLQRLDADREVINCADNTRIMDLFFKMQSYAEYGTEEFLDLFPCLLKELFYNLIHLEEKATRSGTHVSKLIRQALNYINENLYTISDIREISAALFVTETYFFRLFKEQMSISPKKYITRKRLLAAEKQILAGARPTDVYLKCGFNTYPAFYKRYVDFFGRAPSERPCGTEAPKTAADTDKLP